MASWAIALTATLSLVTPLVLAPFLGRRGVIDVPNERSSHASPAVRAVGIAPALAIGAGLGILWASAAAAQVAPIAIVLLSTIAAATIGLVEDTVGISVAIRASLQVGLGLATGCALVLVAGLPWPVVPLVAIFIAGYINAANFMDGIDGVSGMHGLLAGVVFAIVGELAQLEWLVAVGLIIAAAFAAFLPWNMIKGGMFLGDVGSYLLGASVAVVGIMAIASGARVAAIAGVAAIYLVDAGLTLAKRVVRGERWYAPHKSHIYQRLVANGLSHGAVALIVTGASALCAACGIALAYLDGAWPPIAAILGVALLALYTQLPAIIRRVGKDKELRV
jgi:UDP-GlcNAc:undecaprenyl-phosphate GlcNAc-1-phosphate transferase